MSASKDAAFWSKTARKYAADPISNMDGYLKTLERTKSYLKPEDNVLEIGCGTGSTALLIAPHVAKLTASDLAPGMIEIANEKLAEEGLEHVTFQVAEVHDHSKDGASYDAVLAMSVLHLMADRDVALAKIRSLLRPGDLFVSSTMCIGDDLKFFKLIAPIGKAFGLFPTLRVFTSDELCVSIEDSDFDIIQRWKPGRAKATFVIAKAR